MENFIPHKQGERYDTEEERRIGILQSKRKYAAKSWMCETCGTNTSISHRSRHLNSNKHKKKMICS